LRSMAGGRSSVAGGPARISYAQALQAGLPASPCEAWQAGPRRSLIQIQARPG